MQICECIKCLCARITRIEKELQCDCECSLEEWELKQEYKIGDMVKFENQKYCCIKNNHSTEENKPPHATYWVLV